MLRRIGKECSPVVLVVLMMKILVPVQEVEEGAGGDSELQEKKIQNVVLSNLDIQPPS